VTFIGTCYEASGASAPTMVSEVEPEFTAGAGSYFASTESGVIGNLPPGSYQVGFCVKDESANAEHGARNATVISAESRDGALSGSVSSQAAQQ
jgi:hypothetical protein